MVEAWEALLAALTAAYPKADAGRLRDRLEVLVLEARNEGHSDSEIEEQLQSWRIQLFRRRGDWISAEAALSDLQRLLLAGPQSWWGKTWNWLRRIAGFAVNHYVPVAGTVVAIGSALYGLAYAQFYDSLDITPEQAGLTPGQILAHSVIGGLVLVVLIAFALFCVFVPMIPMREKPAEASGNWMDVIKNAILTLAAIWALFKLGSLADVRVSLILPYALFSVLGFFFASLNATHRGWRPVVQLAPLDISFERYVVVMIVCTFPALFLTGSLTFLEAKELGEKVSVGKAVRDPRIGVFPFLGVRAEPALLTWTGRNRVPQVPHCVLYLGSSEGKLVVYDHRSSSTFRIPDNEAALQLQSEMSSCEAPTALRTPSVLRFKPGQMRCTHGKWHSNVKPDFSYEWIAEGYKVEYNRGPHWLLPEKGLRPETVVYCRVKATTPLGDNTAISAPAIITRESIHEGKHSPAPGV